MLIDRPQITESSVIVNATVASGSADPSSPSTGELFYRTDLGAMRVYTGASWVEAGAVALAAHIADPALHLTSNENTFLDALNLPTLTAANVNFLTGLTQNVQSKFNSIDTINTNQDTSITNLQSTSGGTASSLSTHISDLTVHLTSAENTFLDALNLVSPAAAAAAVNLTLGLTSDAQTQLNALSANKYDKTGGTISGSVLINGSLDMSNHVITGVATPTTATDAVNKNYVDNLSQGISWKQPVVAATSSSNGNITLAGTQSLDGVAVASGDRVLVKNQTTSSQNGIYVVSAGAWSRAIDADTGIELDGAAVFVLAGLSHGESGFIQTNSAAGIGGFTGNVLWSQFTTAGGISNSGAGIQISGSVVSVRAGSGLTFGSPTANDLNISATSKFTFTSSQLDLNVTGVTAGTYGSSNVMPTFTVDATGRITFAGIALGVETTNVVNAVVKRDGSGNFGSNVITANSFVGPLTGTASTATNALNLGGVAAAGYALLTGAVFNGDITTYRSGSPTTGVIYLGNNSGTRYLYYDGSQYFLNGANLQINSSLALTAANFNLYAPTLTGTGASGTWSINVTGSAGSATLAAKASTLAQNGGNGTAMTFNWSGQAGQPSWLWGGNDGVNHYVYNPSNFSVANATTVSGYTPSASSGVGSRVVLADPSGYINNSYFNSTDNSVSSGVSAVMVKTGDNYLRSGTAQAVATFLSGSTMNINGSSTSALNATNLIATGSSVGSIYSTVVSSSYSNVMQVREANLGGAQGSANAAAPRLAFHWSGVVASSIAIEPSGRIAIRNNPGTGYEQFGASTIYADTAFTGLVTGSSYGSLTASGTNGGYAGIYLSSASGTVTGMFDGSGNGGNYDASTGWHLYWNRANSCLGIGGSATAAGYRAYTNGSHFVNGALNNSGAASLANGTFVINSSGQVTTIQGISPANGVIRLTPNLHLNSGAGNAVILNWDNGGSGSAQAVRIGNGSGTDAWYVTHAGVVTQTGGLTAGGQVQGTALRITSGGGGELRAQSGGASNTGYVEFYRAGGATREGYIGFATAGGAINYVSETAGSHNFTGAIVASGNITAFSDKRLKTDIEPIHNALDKVSRMNGVSFKRTDTGEYQIGVIAQDMQQVVPEVVQENENGMLSVAYGNLVAVLIEAVKELKAEVAALKAAKE